MRTSITVGTLARAGFTDASKAFSLLGNDELELIAGTSEFLNDLSAAADPDLALLQLSRLFDVEFGGVIDQSDDATVALAKEVSNIRRELVEDLGFRKRLLRVFGASEALGDYVVRHPESAASLLTDADGLERMNREEMQQLFMDSMDSCDCQGKPWEHQARHLRIAYRGRLMSLAARDLSGEVPFEDVTAELADMADAVLGACLNLAKAELPEDAAPCRLAIIAMGKSGARELNYISDVDVIFVAEPGVGPDGELVDETAALATATLLAKGVMRATNEATTEGTIWEVDPALRPEGKSGALVRTLASHIGYYERWAQTWEFQALLKARFAAGDVELGEAYTDAVLPFVWAAADRDGFVTDVQEMRRRVEDSLPASEANREIKLGPGGLRDVEFCVQLLQLVHGRSDVMLRSPNTLNALHAMSSWGYVGRKDASELSDAYRFLRTLEHRTQLFRLQRTHTLPSDEEGLRRIARSIGIMSNPVAELEKEWNRNRLVVRRLHEKIFYRPLLNAVAQLDSGDARLTRSDAIDRMTALGYADPEGALRDIQALSSGVSRRAAIQRTLLPVLLGWFASAPDPDAGLKGFRRVSEALGTSPWYLRLLRDESETAQRMARILASSEFVTELLLKAPEAVALLSDEKELRPRPSKELQSEFKAAYQRQENPEAAIESIRAVRRRELFRISAGDICNLIDVDEVALALSRVADLTIDAAVAVAIKSYKATFGVPLPTRFAVIAMGRLGGNEAGYSSDADVLFVHDPLDEVEQEVATKAALWVANEVRRLLALPSADPPVEIDADLRPEGKTGPLVRSLDSYRAYYDRWSQTWESQAVIRARPIAGDEQLGDEFIKMIDPLRFPADGISDEAVTEIRRLKARMEAERLPRGADPALHTKLGPGGLSDIEWVAQLIQLQHAGAIVDPDGARVGLRSTSTLAVLQDAVDRELLTQEDCDALSHAWKLASRVRNSNVLTTGKASDQIPHDSKTLSGVSNLMGYSPSGASQLVEDYRRASRQSRKITERVFYGWDE